MTTQQMAQHGGTRRLTTETKSFFKTSEFWVYLGAVLAVLIAGNTIEGEEGGIDVFAADKVWLYVTMLTIAYLVSRGIAKAGVRDPYWDRPDTGDGAGGAPLAERVKAAAHVLTDGEAAAHVNPAPTNGPGNAVPAPPPSGPPVA